MRLIADRFAVDDRGHAIDLATGAPVTLVPARAGAVTEQRRWAERCAWFGRVVHPSLPRLIDYGMVDATHRFEAWAAQPGWSGSAHAAAHALSRASRFIAANLRTPLGAEHATLATRRGRPLPIPDASAGEQSGAAEWNGVDDRDLLGIALPADTRLKPIEDLLSAPAPERVTAVGVWAPDGGHLHDAVATLARAARTCGYVPVAAPVLTAEVRDLIRGRTLFIIANDPDQGWRGLVSASLDCPKPHIVLFAGTEAIRCVHIVTLRRWPMEVLIESTCPSVVARRHIRHVTTAARRANGLAGRFTRLLLGDADVEPLAFGDGMRRASAGRDPRCGIAAETAAAYMPDVTPVAQTGAMVSERRWPAPGELAHLRGQVDAARAQIAAGRCRPGERQARQAMHALARRGEWLAAVDAALVLAESLLQRGRVSDADAIIDAARGWGTRSSDLGRIQQCALSYARVRIGLAQLADAETILDAVLTSALTEGGPLALDATLEQARCLYWQGRFADAWQRLAMVHEAELSGRDAARLWTARSRVAHGRGRFADAAAAAARARELASTVGEPRLTGAVLYACALAQLAIGDAAQADAAAVQALDAARRGHDPVRAVCVRTLRAEIARHRGVRRPAMLLARRIARLPASALPVTVRARADLLHELLVAADPADAVERRVEKAGLPALRLFAPERAAPIASNAVDDIVELMRCCQAAEEDEAVLTGVCTRLRRRLRSTGVAFFVIEGQEPVPVIADGARLEVAGARRVLTAGQLVLPCYGAERTEAGVPVRYAGNVVGALVCTWTIGVEWHAADVSVLLSAGATAAGPALSGLAARRAAARVARSSELLGVGTAAREVRAAVDRAASAPFPVMVEGESGSGKELVARLLHRLGARRDRPFCALNCAALPDDLVESELFGHARGAFTGAVAERRGVFEDAHTGTLFLDEIGELSARAQAKLLRTIQEGEIRRVGENTCRRVDVRLVAATNRDLRAEAAGGRFRHDLLYRLDVIRIVLPPLRERREDIPVLAEHFWNDAAGRIGSRATLSSATLAALSRYDWPGNIRELQNVLASLVVRCPKRGVVLPTALPPQFGVRDAARAFTLEAARRTFDQSFIRAALARAGGHRARAAAELGVSRQGLAKLMARLGIDDRDGNSAGA